MSDKLYIVIPAYNEEKNIENCINDWYPIVERHNGEGKSRLFIVDDGSTDDTADLLCNALKDRPLLEYHTKKNGGHGAAVLYGYRYAIEQGADYVFQTDSDGQTLPDEFEPFWKRRKKYDMVIGWRRVRGDGAGRVFVTRTLRKVINLCFRVKIPDANTPYRLMNARTLEKYIDIIPEDYFLTNVVVSVIFKKKGCRTRYIPITFRSRQGGVNSINMAKIVKIGMQALRDFRMINKRL